jgi:hypothetical protein
MKPLSAILQVLFLKISGTVFRLVCSTGNSIFTGTGYSLDK